MTRPRSSVSEFLPAQRKPQLVGIDVRRFRSFLYRHPEIRHIEEKLQEILILRIPTLHAETVNRFPILQCKRWRQGYPRPLMRLNNIERINDGIQYKTLHPLAHAHTRMTRDYRRRPSATGRHRDHPSDRK